MSLSKIVKSIREELSLSQDEFAKKIGVERLAVTRWENGRAVPNRIAQTKIYDIVKESGMDLFSRIVQDIPAHRTENNKIVLYHGSRTGIEGGIRPISRDSCDFGKGFYMGTQAHQPLTLIYSSEKALFYTVELDLTDLNVLRVPAGIEWAMLIAYYRGKMDICAGTALYEKYERMLDDYDVVVGKIADDRMFYVLDRFFEEGITDKGLTESLSALQLGDQYAALTEKACGQIRVLERRGISELERLCIREVSEKNRKHGIETANGICRSHRREGRYFDEILKGGE
jgi:DNA-binding XRE family transcriptional regulator